MNKIITALLLITMLSACQRTDSTDRAEVSPQPTPGNSSTDIADCKPAVERAINDAMFDQQMGKKTEYDVQKAGEDAMDSCMKGKGY